MSTTKPYGSIKGSISAESTLTGTLTIPYITTVDHEVYDGEYKITPTDEVQILPTAKKVLKEDIIVEASPYALPEGTEMASGEDVDGIIDEVFGKDVGDTEDNPSYDEGDIATEEELDDVITDVFG